MCLHPWLSSNHMALIAVICAVFISDLGYSQLETTASLRNAAGIVSTLRVHCSAAVSEITGSAFVEGLKQKFRSRMHYCWWGLAAPGTDVFVRKHHGFIQSKANSLGSVKYMLHAHVLALLM